ncbi:MAG: SCO family protein [Myxococcales bacterium]|nr:SCO family protein [Myxococcales bacterium]
MSADSVSRPPTSTRGRKSIVLEVFGEWGFAAFLLASLLFGVLLLLLALLTPTAGTPLERFAEDFRVWCFGYDPRTGEMQWAYVIGMLTSPMLLASFTLMIWWAPLRKIWYGARSRLLYAIVPALLLVGGLGAGMGLLLPEAEAETLAFPADALRTSTPAPAFALVDHEGTHTSLDELRGRILVITGVYAHCTHTCPLILTQIKSTLSELTHSEREAITVLGISLDPERDDPEALAAMAAMHSLSAPTLRLLSGDPAEVNAVLDRYSFSRRRIPETGVIDHANLFVVIDRDGNIAYRFALGEQQERWLVEALRLLIAEGRAADRQRAERDSGEPSAS